MVSKFEAEHREEIDEILGLIDYIDKWYVEKISLRFTNLAAKGWVYTWRINWLLRVIQPINRGYNQLDYFKKTIKAHQGRDSDAVKYVKKVKALIDKPLDEIELEDVRLATKKVKCPANWIFQYSIN